MCGDCRADEYERDSYQEAVENFRLDRKYKNRMSMMWPPRKKICMGIAVEPKVYVLRDGNITQTLTMHEFNTHVCSPNETYDFRDFNNPPAENKIHFTSSITH